MAEFPDGEEPHVIIGHARITGRYAHALQVQRPSIMRVHMIHMSPEEIEPLKDKSDQDPIQLAEIRRQQELELSREAHLVVAVGERLRSRFARDLAHYNKPVVGLHPGFDDPDSDPNRLLARQPPGEPLMVLFVGRADDYKLKGVDIAVKAFTDAIGFRSAHLSEAELVIRGVPAQQGAQLLDRARKWTEGKRVRVYLRPYSDADERLKADLHSATLVIMPSRAEGYGLVGVEAIASGTPLLVGPNSGLADFLSATLPVEVWTKAVVHLPVEERDRVSAWSRAIGGILQSPIEAFRTADHIRNMLGREQPWAKTADDFLTAIARTGPPAGPRHWSLTGPSLSGTSVDDPALALNHEPVPTGLDEPLGPDNGVEAMGDLIQFPTRPDVTPAIGSEVSERSKAVSEPTVPGLLRQVEELVAHVRRLSMASLPSEVLALVIPVRHQAAKVHALLDGLAAKAPAHSDYQWVTTVASAREAVKALRNSLPTDAGRAASIAANRGLIMELADDALVAVRRLQRLA